MNNTKSLRIKVPKANNISENVRTPRSCSPITRTPRTARAFVKTPAIERVVNNTKNVYKVNFRQNNSEASISNIEGPSMNTMTRSSTPSLQRSNPVSPTTPSRIFVNQNTVNSFTGINNSRRTLKRSNGSRSLLRKGRRKTRKSRK